MSVNIQLGAQRKSVFKGTAKNCDLTKNSVNAASDP